MGVRETVSDVFLETLYANGVRMLFANTGTDHPPLLESLAKYAAQGVPLPTMIVCPHETTAITAAHGAYLASGRAQGVFVHVGVGTQNLGGAAHQAWAGRIPMLVFAGRAPVTTRGELPGSRDNFIHYIQDVRDQAGAIRQYCKWEFNLELPEQIAYAVQRGLRVMNAEPPGAVYMTAAREVLGMPAPALAPDPPEWYARPALGRLRPEDAGRLAEALRAAERPLILTSYLGRQPQAVEVLVALSETLQVPVLEATPTHLNFPRTHPHHWGYRAGTTVQDADLILLVDTDVPWVPKLGAPRSGTPVVQIDVDPIKPHIVLWDFPVTESHQVNSFPALAQVLECARALPPPGAEWREARARWLATHRPPRPQPALTGPLTAAGASAVLRQELDADTVLFNEGISNVDAILAGTQSVRPGSYFGLPGGSLGWGGGAAFGYKLMLPQAEVAWLVGDGSFLFSVPSSLFMTVQRYRAPFLTVIYNNSGWRAVKLATDRMYGAAGHAARGADYHHTLGPEAPLERIAEAFGCYGAQARDAEGLTAALREARRQIAAGRAAVINCLIAQD
jgi:acetolactate synthase-1/2/3 large subunit